MSKKVLVVLILIIGCAMPNQPGPVTTAAPPSEFKNLQVLPRNITRDELLATMRGFTRGLGVRCDHCHVVTATQPRQEFDFPSDTKENKRAARGMLRMVMEINRTLIPRALQAAGERVEEGEQFVTCWTCHRGHEEPEEPPPPAPAP
jgi:hypothetical protein